MPGRRFEGQVLELFSRNTKQFDDSSLSSTSLSVKRFAFSPYEYIFQLSSQVDFYIRLKVTSDNDGDWEKNTIFIDDVKLDGSGTWEPLIRKGFGTACAFGNCLYIDLDVGQPSFNEKFYATETIRS